MNYHLGIVADNTFNGEIKQKNGIFLSTKHEGQGHGLRSIQTIVEKYDGIVVFLPMMEYFGSLFSSPYETCKKSLSITQKALLTDHHFRSVNRASRFIRQGILFSLHFIPSFSHNIYICIAKSLHNQPNYKQMVIYGGIQTISSFIIKLRG